MLLQKAFELEDVERNRENNERYGKLACGLYLFELRT